MTYILIFLFLLSLFCFFISRMDKYSLYFVAISATLILGLYSSILLISISGNYTSIGYAFGWLDRKLFLSIIQNRMHYFFVIRIFNAAIAFYPLLLISFTVSYFKTNKNHYIIPFLLLSILQLIFYDPYVIYKMYCICMASENNTLFNLICIADLLFHILIITSLIVPFVYLLRTRKSIVTSYKRRQLYGIMIFIGLMDFLYACVIRLSSLRNLYIGKTPYFLIQIRTYGALFKHEYIVYPILMLISLVVIFFTVNTFHLIRTTGISAKFATKNHSSKINKNLIGVFHSVKNVVYSFGLQLNNAISLSEPDKEEELKRLSSEIYQYVDHLSVMLASNNNTDSIFTFRTSAKSIISEAIDSVNKPDNVDLTTELPEEDYYVFADTYYINIAISNVIKNAYDAIADTGKSGQVIVKLFSEFDSIVFAVCDNGIGLDKKLQKKIFKPFYTTKSRILNWGVGLSFTKKIIASHKGHISISSKPNEGTNFYIILPKC